MSDVIDNEGFRANVGIVLMRGDGSVFLGRRARGGGWQFPQGGMQTGEAPEQSLYRELHEEIGLTAQRRGTARRHRSGWMRYRLPSRYVRRDQLPLCIGQKQRWFLLRLRDGRRELRLHRDQRAGVRPVALVGLVGTGARGDLLQASGVRADADRACGVGVSARRAAAARLVG